MKLHIEDEAIETGDGSIRKLNSYTQDDLKLIN